jgi:DNA topoisomerase-2
VPDAAAALSVFFKLTSPVSTRNMHLFDAGGAIRRYDRPEDVLAEFLPVRRALYAARLLRSRRWAEHTAAREEARRRFLEDVVSGRMAVGRRPRLELERGLWEAGFPVFLTPDDDGGATASGGAGGGGEELPGLGPVAHLLDHTALVPPRCMIRPPDAAGGVGAPPPAARGGFDYLLNLPIWQLTEGSLHDAARRVAGAQAALAEARTASPVATWRAELDRLAGVLQADPAFR